MIAGGSAASAAKAKAKQPASSGKTLVIEGAGDGHGVGMSQWGALGYAEHGWSANAILAHYYAGTAIGHVSKQHIVKVLVGSHVEKLPIETYVKGVVAAEMPSSWPTAALEAQAIASRTYALTSDAGGSRFDVYADTRSQVYLGKAAETPRSNAAVKATEGEIVTYEGQPAITFFFASSGGMTESVQNAFAGSLPEPWLKAVSDKYESGPLQHWTISRSFSEAASELNGLVRGSFAGIEVIKRGVSPRVLSAYVLGSKGRTEVSGAELEARLGLDSTWDYFSVLAGGKQKREPDLSGKQQPAQPLAEEPPVAPAATPEAPPAEEVIAPSGGTTPAGSGEGGGVSAP
ncbi:MAG TPA: SpoIID/LytB domain-containing protein [Solirubrobacteraceae bacterium]